jgi:hypothetical protein
LPDGSTFAEQYTETGRLQLIFLPARPHLRRYITSVLETVLFDNLGINHSTLGTGRHEFPQIITYTDSFVLKVNVVLMMGYQSGVGHFIIVIKFYIFIPSY